MYDGRDSHVHFELVSWVKIAIMAEAMKSDVPRCCSSHIPQQWETNIVQTTSENGVVEANSIDRKSDLQQWKNGFGLESGRFIQTQCLSFHHNK